MKKPKLYDCEVINSPKTAEEQEAYDKKICKSLATALHRSLDAERLDLIIETLKKS